MWAEKRVKNVYFREGINWSAKTNKSRACNRIVVSIQVEKVLSCYFLKENCQRRREDKSKKEK